MAGAHRAERRVGYLFLLGICCFLLYMFAWQGMRFFLIPSDSMEPTLLRRDYVVTLNYGHPPREPERADIIVFRDPEEPGEYTIKRVVGLPGETIEIRDGAVFINGDYLSEPYVVERPVYTYEAEVIPEDQYFVLGDNRNLSSDSSLWHRSIPRDDIIGRAVFIYNPIKRMGRIR